MGNSDSKLEEKRLLYAVKEDLENKNDFVQNRSKQTGRIIQLPNRNQNERKTGKGMANYHFIAAIDDALFAAESISGVVHCFCLKTGTYFGNLKPRITSSDVRGITVIKTREVKERLIIVIGDQGMKHFVAIDVDVNGVVKSETQFGSFEQCCGLASNGFSRLYTTDWVKNTVSIFELNPKENGISTPSFQLIKTIRHAKLCNPYCISYHNQSILIGQPMTSSVLIFSEKGNLLREISYEEMRGNESPRGVTINNDGNILVANGLGNDVHILNQKGHLLRVLKDDDILNAKCIRDIVCKDKKIILLANLIENSFDDEVLVIL